MADTFFVEGLNTLPEQVQLNKEDIKTLNAKIDTITSNIANLGWELKHLEYSFFDVDLTTAGLAKIQANATIGTSINLVKGTDFIENIYNTNSAHRTVIFTLYRDDDEEVYISNNIKLDIVNTTAYYYDNDQTHIWFTGLGVIKLGSALASDNNYLCYIAYDTTYTESLMITPVQKLN